MSYNMMNNATPARKTSKVSNTPKKLFQNAINKIGAQVGQDYSKRKLL